MAYAPSSASTPAIQTGRPPSIGASPSGSGCTIRGGSDFHGERIKPEIQLKAVALELPWLPAQEEI